MAQLSDSQIKDHRDDPSSSRAYRTAGHKDSDGAEGYTHSREDVQDPNHLGSTATEATQWWSDRSETPTPERKHNAYDSDDERYFSDHFIEELKSRTESVTSGQNTSRPHVPMGKNTGRLTEKSVL